MTSHVLKVKLDGSGTGFEIEYYKQGAKDMQYNAYPSLIVQPEDEVLWELQIEGVLVVVFPFSAAPFEKKGATSYGKMGEQFGGTIVAADKIDRVVNKYTLIFTSTAGVLKDPVVVDPHIIIDNNP